MGQWADEENYFEQGIDSHGYPFVTIYGTDDQEIKFCFQKDGKLDTKAFKSLSPAERATIIKIAKGEYVFNLDADDAIENDALKSAFEIIQSTDADIVSFSHKYYTMYADICIYNLHILCMLNMCR